VGWAIGYETRRDRYIGYSVPAPCDYPKCDKEIDRGLSFVCGSDPHGGEYGCGLYFCEDHMRYRTPRYSDRAIQLCPRCIKYRGWYTPKPELTVWLRWMLEDNSWQEWRDENPDKVRGITEQLEARKVEAYDAK
jgi:hypothetical protein